jgi:hypothetical protein
MSLVTAFDDVARALAETGSSVHPAEAHGCLAGALCVRRGYRCQEWLEEILPDVEGETGRQPAPGACRELFDETLGALEDTDMHFSPLLPDDETSLGDRVRSLGAWCQGFLYGFGAAGGMSGVEPGGDLAEVLGDFSEIARADVSDTESEEVQEEAYAELVEFVRAGVQLVYEDLEPLRDAQPASDWAH